MVAGGNVVVAPAGTGRESTRGGVMLNLVLMRVPAPALVVFDEEAGEVFIRSSRGDRSSYAGGCGSDGSSGGIVRNIGTMGPPEASAPRG